VSIALANMVLDLRRRVEALERAVTASPRRYGVLYAQAKAMKAQGEALKAEIRAILESHKGPRRLKAYAVLTLLRRDPPPSLRRVQQLVKELRAASADSRQGPPSTDPERPHQLTESSQPNIG
jgi:uncharacterized protein involved in exopolysaccharide biosynthesis